MRHTKLIVFGIVLAVVIIFGFIFWYDLKFNQEELSNTPLPPSPLVDDSQPAPANNTQQQGESDTQPALSENDDYDDLEKDLNQTDLNSDSDNAQLESELSEL